MSKSIKTVIPAKAGIQKTKGLVPRLRFPEFRDEGEWQESQLTEIANFHKGKGISKADIKPTGSQPCIRYGELYTVYGDVISDVFSKTDVSPGNLFMSREGDVIIPSSGETKIDIATAACVLRENIALGGDLNVIRSKQNGVFLSYYLNGSLKHEIAKIAQGDTVVHLYKSNLEALKLAIPKVREQHKIADCLSSLDALITAHTEKLDALKTHKKGLMQQLFPREGETVPRLRFPEFRDAGEWINMQLGQLGKLVSGLTYSPDDIRDKGLLVLRSSNIKDGRIVLDDNVYVRSGLKGVNLSKPGDVLICVRNGSKPLIGKNAIINKKTLPCTHGAFMTVFRSKRPEFVYQLFQTEAYKRQVSADLGATINSINGNNLKRYEFCIPSSEVEQQRIADILSSLDTVIAAHSGKRDALKAHKKGLMQQLFPSPEAVGV